MEDKCVSGQQYTRVMELLKSVPLDQVMIGIASWLKSQDSEVVESVVNLATREREGRGEIESSNQGGWKISICTEKKGSIEWYAVSATCQNWNFSEGNQGGVHTAWSHVAEAIDDFNRMSR